MNAEECFKKGLLKKEAPSSEKAKKSVDVAEFKLNNAKKLLKLGILDMTYVNVYSSMFHSSRALLFRDGIKERSHYAIYVYLKERYSDKIEQRFLNELNVLRLERHEIMYGFEQPRLNEEEIKELIGLVGEYIDVIKRLL